MADSPLSGCASVSLLRMLVFHRVWTYVLEDRELIPARVLEDAAGSVGNLERSALRARASCFELADRLLEILHLEYRQTARSRSMISEKQQWVVT